MKKIILLSLVALSLFACRKVEKEVSNPVIETPQEIVEDSVNPGSFKYT